MVCSDKMETRCHLEIMVFFSSWRRWLIPLLRACVGILSDQCRRE